MIIAVYKPIGPSSQQMINRVKRWQKVKKVGHAGTLDPLARGVLVVGVGREGTKQLTTIIKNDKEYLATIRLGMSSTTDDEGGEKNAVAVKQPPTLAEVQAVLPRFVGIIAQVPPVYSAIKQQGSRAYRLARRGHEVKLAARSVEIKAIEVLSYRWPLLRLRVATGSGVYVRALARDLGAALGVGGYISDLERTAVGQWRREAAISLSHGGELLLDRVQLDDRISRK